MEPAIRHRGQGSAENGGDFVRRGFHHNRPANPPVIRYGTKTQINRTTIPPS